MVKVITYGTYDLLHHGHVKLLERAKALGDYLIVGVTSDDYDKSRGKINNQQSLMDRVNAVRATGIADEVIVEEYDGQKIDDIRRYGVDIFTVGSDWEGKFDYLGEYCKVVYLPRTQGVSSTEIRAKNRKIRIGIIGGSGIGKKFIRESQFVNGCEVVSVCCDDVSVFDGLDVALKTDDIDKMLGEVDAVYVVSHPRYHYEHIKRALQADKHVICESPVAISADECDELFELARQRGCVLMDAIKTAYSTAYERLLLMLKGGIVGNVVSVDATCTSLKQIPTDDPSYFEKNVNSISAWGPTAMLPIFQLLGTSYREKHTVAAFADGDKTFDYYTKIDFVYDNATASIKVGKGIKSEGELIVSGTKGYIYVPAPWWKTDYFEVRYENPEENRRCFYQLNGEGIRYQIVAFLKSIENNSTAVQSNISEQITRRISTVIEDFNNRKDFTEIGTK